MHAAASRVPGSGLAIVALRLHPALSAASDSEAYDPANLRQLVRTASDNPD